MNKYAVFHVLDTPYSYGKDKNTLIVRVRVARNDVKECYVYYKDRYDWKNPYNKKVMKVEIVHKSKEESHPYVVVETNLSELPDRIELDSKKAE